MPNCFSLPGQIFCLRRYAIARWITMEDEAKVEGAAQLAMQSEVFKAMGLAAIRARARRLDPGDVARVGGCDFVVDLDEHESWVVVQIIWPKAAIEEIAESKASELGVDLQSMSLELRRQWLSEFLVRLKAMLEKWYGIRCIPGPGDNLTFEKAAYKSASEDWR